MNELKEIIKGYCTNDTVRNIIDDLNNSSLNYIEGLIKELKRNNGIIISINNVTHNEHELCVECKFKIGILK